MRHLISPLDLSIEELDYILSLGQEIMEFPEKFSHICEGKKLAKGKGRSKKLAEMEAKNEADKAAWNENKKQLCELFSKSLLN